MEFKGYKIEELQAGLFAICDEKTDAMYLIVGEQKALLIDTGTMKPDIMPMLRTLTDKPIELALTHAHIDHMYHAGEFNTVYLHKNDIAAWKKGVLQILMLAGFAMFHVPAKRFQVSGYIPVSEETKIDLGGVQVRVVDAPGHTPGSCVYVCDALQTVFMGDAVGSGGPTAWLWLPGSLHIGAYRDHLKQLQEKLEPFASYRFLGGHSMIDFVPEDMPDFVPLSLKTVKDMYTLCEKMLSGSIEPKTKQKQALMTVWQYAYGTAGMWVTKRKIRE